VIRKQYLSLILPVSILITGKTPSAFRRAGIEAERKTKPIMEAYEFFQKKYNLSGK